MTTTKKKIMKSLFLQKISVSIALKYKSFTAFSEFFFSFSSHQQLVIMSPKKVKKLFLTFCVMNTIVLPVSSAMAQENRLDSASQEKLLAFTKKFIQKTKKNKAFQEASYSQNENQKFLKQLNQIPDGQGLLLRPRVGNLVYEFDIYAIKKNYTLYFSLLDMIEILELAIDFDQTSKTGEGWFLREDWEINIDIPNNRVTSRGENISLLGDDYYDENGEVFVSQEALSKWFFMSFQADVAQQYLEIDSPYPLPGVARNYRLERNAGGDRSSNEAVLPRKQIEYDWLDINTADIRIGTRYRRQGDADATRQYNANVALQGQALKHEAYALASYDNDDNLSAIRTRLSKVNEDPVLLGPLKARSYSIGDTDLTELPLTGDARQELGFRVSNSELRNDQFETTDINGDAIPGWDVELYRNGVLVGSVLVDETGRYEFPDVQLFAGENEFEIFFYGLQGEIRNRKINIPVNEELLASQDNTYDVSASLSDRQTYRKIESDEVDRGAPHFVARYNKVIGDALAYVGVRNRDIEGENKTFVAAGATKLWQNTIFDVNVATDDEANAAAQIIARRNINDWNIALRGLVQDENYIADESTNPRIFDVSANAQRNFRFTDFTRTNVSARAGYSENADGQELTSARLGLGHQFGQFNISDTLTYEKFDGGELSRDNRINNTLSLRANMGKVFARGGINYEIKPDQEIDRYFSQISYRPNQTFSGDLFLDHEPDRDFSEARLNLNYTHKNFRTTPFIEIDSDDEIFAGVNVNFNIIDAPDADRPIITSDRTIGRGLVSAFVYHDQNGNKVYDAGDEPLPEVIVESVNVRRRAETNEKGFSLIRNLPNVRATDIVVDDQTLPDPYMISAFEGVSIFPSAGEIVEIEFPVHMSGEIDGTAFIRDPAGSVRPLKGGEVELLALENKKKKRVSAPIAIDGFFVVPQIPPGEYLMQITNATAKKNKAATPAPRIVEIGFDGEVLYSQNVELLAKRKNVELNVNYTQPESFELPSMNEPYYTLKIGQKSNSKLLSLVSRFAKKKASTETFSGLTKLSMSEDKTETYYTGHGNSYEALHARCEGFIDQGIPCSLEVWVPPKDQIIKVAAKTDEKQ